MTAPFSLCALRVAVTGLLRKEQRALSRRRRRPASACAGPHVATDKPDPWCLIRGKRAPLVVPSADIRQRSSGRGRVSCEGDVKRYRVATKAMLERVVR